ncbi:MAG: PIG-L family deacetylase [Clostridia bacterium]|nr:PIG-L family deacetylase [Clostridia bacterium]MBR1585618.1 PIG-L family deacetylase [Clostridia bacterium]
MKRIPVFFCLAALLLLLPLTGWAVETTTCPASFTLNAVNKTRLAAYLYQKSGTQYKEIDRIPAGKSCKVLGKSGQYYKVSYEKQTGYVRQDTFALQAKSSSKALSEMKQTGLSLADYIPQLSMAKRIKLQGTIRTEKPIDTLYVFLWDERQMKAEKAYVISLPEAKTSVNAESLQSQLNLEGVRAGRKMVVVQASSGGKQYALYRTVLSLRGNAKEPASITAQCTFSNNAVADTDLSTIWSPTKTKPALTVDIPAGAKPSLLTMDWKVRPQTWTIELFGDKDALISKETLKTNFYSDHYPLTSDVRRVRITATGEKCSINTLRVYGPQYDTLTVQEWQPLPSKVDILFFPTHADDELLFFGGAIPYYSAKGYKVAVIYATDNGRTRYKEAMDGLWAAGLKYHPIFLGWHNFKASSVKAAMGDWNYRNGDVQMKLVRQIRKYKPSVVVTHGFDGEYGHSQHMATAQMMADAITLANDPTYDPESVQTYGTWQIQKMYAHRYKENQITMDWNQPLEPGSVITPMFLAKEAYDRHRSQQKGFSMEVTSTRYDCRLFGLYYSAVGPDVKKNDFMENIP